MGLSGWTDALNRGLEVGVVVSPTHGDAHASAFTNPQTTTRAEGYASQLMSVTAGQRYRLSAWFRSSIGYVAYPTGTAPLMRMHRPYLPAT